MSVWVLYEAGNGGWGYTNDEVYVFATRKEALHVSTRLTSCGGKRVKKSIHDLKEKEHIIKKEISFSWTL